MNRKLKNILIPAGILVVLVFFSVVLYPSLPRKNPAEQVDPTNVRTATFTAPAVAASSCATTKETYVVQGGSLSGVLESGNKVTVEMNYYACNDAKPEDIVLYNRLQGSTPLIKIVKGVPGDKLTLAKAGEVWNILINGGALKTSKGEAYAGTFPIMLDYYLNAFKGVIPADEYLLLGNLAAGSEDSTAFGLAGKINLLGKVLR